MAAPLLIAVAPTGARRTKADHPALPLTPQEIGREAARAAEAGAAMIHLHVRDAAGRHSLDPDLYREAIAAVRREAGDGLLVQATTEAVGIYSAEEQMAAMEALRPEAFSVAVRELFAEEGREGAGAAFLAARAREGVLVQHILYDAADVARFQDLVARGAIPEEGTGALFVLGRYAPGQLSDPADLLPFLAAWRLPIPWMLCAFGPREAACALAAACLGGHARVGFENNLHLPDGRLAPDNASLVAAVAEAAARVGLRTAGAWEARALLARQAGA